MLLLDCGDLSVNRVVVFLKVLLSLDVFVHHSVCSFSNTWSISKKDQKKIDIQHSVQANFQRTKNVPAFGVRGDKQFQVFFNADDCHIVGDMDMDHMDTP